MNYINNDRFCDFFLTVIKLLKADATILYTQIIILFANHNIPYEENIRIRWGPCMRMLEFVG